MAWYYITLHDESAFVDAVVEEDELWGYLFQVVIIAQSGYHANVPVGGFGAVVGYEHMCCLVVTPVEIASVEVSVGGDES